MNPQQQTTKSSVSKDITSWTHVFLWKDAVRAPLTGLYHVLACTDKLFTLDVSDKKETVSIDKLKWAFTDTATQEPHIPHHIHFSQSNAGYSHNNAHSSSTDICHHYTLWSASMAQEAVQNSIYMNNTDGHQTISAAQFYFYFIFPFFSFSIMQTFL